MSDEEWYLQQCGLRALRGDTVALPPDDPDSNIHSIELARTQRAIRMMRENAFKERPL